MEGISFRKMEIDDYDRIYELWMNTRGVSLSQADSKESILSFLRRNPDLSIVALKEEMIVATILGGHDGRRGYIHHLAVEERVKKSGIGKRLVELVIEKLKDMKIEKCHLFVLQENDAGISFWLKQNFELRQDIQIMSKVL